jgi:hypothetical protein
MEGLGYWILDIVGNLAERLESKVWNGFRKEKGWCVTGSNRRVGNWLPELAKS